MGVENYMNVRRDLGAYIRTRRGGTEPVSFLTPTLRELTWTAPYMHNGVFGTLDEVVDFYNRGRRGRSEQGRPAEAAQS